VSVQGPQAQYSQHGHGLEGSLCTLPTCCSPKQVNPMATANQSEQKQIRKFESPPPGPSDISKGLGEVVTRGWSEKNKDALC
jgi:hypothetical protein